MRVQEFLRPPELKEVKMNPGAFAFSTKDAASRGVLVGYEFEVLVPKASVEKWQASQQTAPTLTLNQMISNQTIADILTAAKNRFEQQGQSADLDRFGTMFKTPDGRHSPKGAFIQSQWENPALVKRYIAFIKKNLQDPMLANEDHVRQRFLLALLRETGYDLTQDNYGDRYPDDVTDEFVNRAKRVCYSIYLNTSSPVDLLFNKMSDWPERITYKNYNLSTAAGINKFSKWVKLTYGTDVLQELLTDGLWSFNGPNLIKAKKQLRAMLDPNYVDPADIGDLYNQAAQMINATMSPTFGTMTVFDRYHQADKELDRWYIEPDRSLKPNPDDTSCEIVGPPTPAAKAMSDLRSFYSLANSLQLYTNSSTGLHVNVSIPAELDVLKLAVLLGDQYVLQSFGRANSTFAQSVMARLQKDELPQVTDIDQYRSILSRLVDQASSSHFASINWNGKYVSFRQAGGDYLANQTQIENTVGRFVRAMVIASDPATYRNEYMKKLVAMATPSPGRATRSDAKIAARTNGIWVVEINGGILYPERIGGTEFIEPWLKRYASKITYNRSEYQVIVNDPHARRVVLAADGLTPVTRDKLNVLPSLAFFRIILSGPSIEPTVKQLIRSNELQANGMYNEDDLRVGIIAKTAKLLKPNDPEFAQAFATRTAGAGNK